MSLAIRAIAWLQSVVDDLPQDVVDELPEDVITDLRDGVIDKIPEDVVDRLPEGVRDQIPDSLVEFATGNPGFAAFLAVVGVIAVIGFVWGIAKSAIKAVLFFGVVGAAAWFLFFQQ